MEQVTIPLWVMVAILAVLGFLLTFILNGIYTGMKEVRVGVGNINGAVNGLNVWKDSHEKQDDERHKETRGRQIEIVQALNDISNNIERRRTS